MSRRTVLPSPVVSLHAGRECVDHRGRRRQPGRGSGAPKQYEQLGARRIIDHAVDVARAVSDGVVRRRARRPTSTAEGGVAGGATRSDSVRAGLAAVPADGDDRLRARCRPPVRLGATVRGGDRRRVATAPTARCRAFPSPTRSSGSTATTSSSTRRRGRRWSRCRPRRRSGRRSFAPRTRSGRRRHRRRRAGRGLRRPGRGRRRRAEQPQDHPSRRPRVGTRAGREGRPMTDVRVGQGFDIHRFSDDPARPLVLGGVAFDGERGCTATATPTSSPMPSPTRCSAPPVSATSASTFPTPTRSGRAPTRWRCSRHAAHTGARRRLDHRQRRLLGGVRARRSWRRTEPRCSAKLSEACGAPVTVKGRRAEGLGALGRGEGIACWAVAVITKE